MKPQLTKLLFNYGAYIIILAGCSQTAVTDCNDKVILNQLVWQLQPKDPLITKTISSIELINNHQNQLLSCKARLNYHHKILKNTLVVDYQYQIDRNGKLVQPLLSTKNQIQFNQWYKKLPQVINYQKSQYGVIAIIQPATPEKNDHNQAQQLIFNDNILQLSNNHDYSTITLDHKFILAHHEVFIISAYLNHDQDQNINHNYILEIRSESQVAISQSFTYQESSLHQVGDSLIFNGTSLNHPYAESLDYSQYKYQLLELTKVKSAPPDSYYRQKFAKMNAEGILRQVKADGCLNGDQFYLSDICSKKKITYCFQFKSIPVESRNQAYSLLHEMCNPYQFSD